MKTKTVMIILAALLIPTALFAVDIEDFEGIWEWAEPIYSTGGRKGVDGYTDFTLILWYDRMDNAYVYKLLDEKEKELHGGHAFIKDGILVLDGAYGEPAMFTVSEGFMGMFELCEYHDYPSQNAYFTISRRTGN